MGIFGTFLSLESTYEIYVDTRKDDETFKAGSWVPIGEDWAAVEIAWKASDEAGLNNGYLKLYVDGQLVTTLSNLDNDTYGINSVYLITNAVNANTTGSLNFDDFVANDIGYICLTEAADIPTNPLADAIWLENVYTHSKH